MEATGFTGTAQIRVAGRTVLAEHDGSVQSATVERASQASSISKQLLAVVVLQLVEAGRFTVDTTVADLLPAGPSAWAPLTVHQLLTHTAGLGHWDDVPGLDLAAGVTRAEVDALVAAAPLVAEPGERFAYSGPGYLLLAALVEAAEHRPYADVVRDRVVRPAGMTATTSGARPADAATGRHEGVELPVDPVFTAMPGTGDLWTTTGDLLAFAAALRDGRLLRPDTLAAMTTPHVAVEPSGSVGLAATAYGHGTFLGTVAGRPARFHPGDNPGYTSVLAHLPDVDADVAVLLHDEVPRLGSVVAGVVTRALGPA